MVFGWLPAMLTARGLRYETATSALAIYNLGGVVGILLWSAIVPIFGSRGPVLVGALGCAASALALLTIPVHAHHTLLLVCIAMNGLLANAVQVSLYALAAHVYPTAMRATGVAYSGTIGRAGGLLSSLIGASVIQAPAGTYWRILAIAMLCASAGSACVRSHYLPTGTVHPK